MLRHIVIVSEAADAKGGASLAAIQSAFALARTGLSVRLFAATGPFNPPAEVPASFQVRTLEDGLDLVKAPRLQRATMSLWNGPAADAFAEFISDLDPRETVVHVHSFQVQLTSSVVRRARDLGFPLVLTSHDYGIACPYSGFYNYNTGAPCGRRALSLGCATTVCNESRSVPGKLWHVGKGFVQRGKGRVPRGFDHLVFVSDFSRQILKSYFPDRLPTSVVRNPISLPHDPPRELRNEAPFLFVGRLTREKGAKLFAEAAKQIGASAWIAGTGPEEAEIRALNPDMTLFGWQSPAQVRDLMRQARALVFPSRWYEGQPLTVQEAQSVGLPVIASDVSAARSTVEDGVTGRIFRSGDAADLAEKMAGLLDDEKARSMGKAAYAAYWSNPPTEAAHVEGLLAVYEQVRQTRGFR